MLDIAQPDQLAQYLRNAGHIQSGERPQISELAGGVSNTVMLVQRSNGTAWVIKQALAKLRVSVEWFCDPSRIEREALGLRRLSELAPTGSITPLVFLDPSVFVLAMQAVPKPHDNWKTRLLGGSIQPEQFAQFGRLLSAIHAKSSQRSAELAGEFSDWSYFEALRLEPYYGYTAARLPKSRSFLLELIAQTRGHRLALVHGDFSPKNVLVRGDGQMVLLDHEVVHWGDGAFDVGFALTHFLAKAIFLPQHRNELLRAATVFWNQYSAGVSGQPWAEQLPPRAVRHTLGCIFARLAGRSQLEYLDVAARERLLAWAYDRLAHVPASPGELLDQVVCQGAFDK